MARRKRRIRYGRLLFSLSLIALVSFAGYVGISRLTAWMSRCSPVSETIQVSRSLNGTILRDESRVYTQNGGKVTYFVQDGEKVQTGQKIAEIIVSGAVQTPLGAPGPQGVLETNKQKKSQLDAEIGQLLSDIATGVNSGEISGISSLKSDINMKLAEKVQLEHEITSLENGYQPETAAAGSANAKTGQVLEIRSPGSGIVSFYSDGLEEALKPGLYRTIVPGALESKEPVGIAAPDIQPGGLLYKLVDTSVWYLMVPISPTDRQVLGQTQGLDLRIGDEAFQASLKDVLEQEGQPVLMLESRGALPDFHKVRQLAVEVVMDRYPGLAIPQSAIIEKNGQMHVLTVDSNNRKEAVPVQVISKLPDRTVVAEGSFFSGTGKELTQIGTISQKDYVLRSPTQKDILSSQSKE